VQFFLTISAIIVIFYCPGAEPLASANRTRGTPVENHWSRVHPIWQFVLVCVWLGRRCIRVGSDIRHVSQRCTVAVEPANGWRLRWRLRMRFLHVLERRKSIPCHSASTPVSELLLFNLIVIVGHHAEPSLGPVFKLIDFYVLFQGRIHQKLDVFIWSFRMWARDSKPTLFPGRVS